MPKSLTIGTQTFEFPNQGDNPDYGEEITSWAEAVTDALGDVQGAGDILLTTANILNNQSSFTNVSGFSFSTATVRRIDAEYLVERSTVTPAQKFVEAGRIEGYYDGTAWGYSITTVGDAGMEFEITSGGQVRYKSSNITGSSYAGTIKFRAKAITI